MTSSTFYARLAQGHADSAEEETGFANVEETNDLGDVLVDRSQGSPSGIDLGAAGTSFVDRIENIVQKEH
jgi:hypothetical protein